MLHPRDLEVINLELATTIQDMDEAVRNGKTYNQDTLSYLEDMRAALARVRQAMRTPHQQRSDLRVIDGGLSAA